MSKANDERRPVRGSDDERADLDRTPGANPDEGWQDGPAGHREGRSADDDMVRRKG